MGIEYAIIVKNKTRLESLIARFNTKAQAKFYIEKLGGDFDDYEKEHEVFHQSLHTLQTKLSTVMKHKIVERVYLPSFLFSERNLIVTIGQDGLVANTAKYAAGLPIIAVNPDKNRYDGVLLPFSIGNFLPAVENVLAGSYNAKVMHFAAAKLNDGQRLIAFNDLFIGASSHVSARYKVSFNGVTEEQSSSGIIVSTQAGATGWLSSIFNMAYGVTGIFEKKLQPKRAKVDENELLFVVREPFKSIKTNTGINAGIISGGRQLVIESLMPEGGVIFSDGIEADYLKFNSGAIAKISLAEQVTRLVI